MLVDPIIEMKNVCKSFGSFKALDGIDFSLLPGEIHFIVGENGAGKTLLSNILYGLASADSGSIYYKRAPMHIKGPRQAQQCGIFMLHQNSSFLNNQDVAHNMWSGCEPVKTILGFQIIDNKRLYTDTSQILNKLNLKFTPHTLVGDLGRAQKQLLNISRLFTQPYEVVILDEPTESLDDPDKEMFYDIVLGLKKKGGSIVYISHRINEVKLIGDRVTILSNGKLVDTVAVKKTDTDTLLKKIFGQIQDKAYPKIPLQPGIELLRVKELCCSNILKDISFTIRKGEIIGLAGLMGSGRSLLAKSIIGASNYDSGEIFIEGNRVKIKSPSDAVNLGIGYISDDRNSLGLFSSLDLNSNLISGNAKSFNAKFFIRNKKIREICKSIIKRLGIKVADIYAPVGYLSGGNQQKVVISKWLNHYAKIFIMDEPTINLDIPSRGDLYNIMNELIRNGAGILFISSNISELIGMCDRILAISNGRIVKQFYGERTTPQEIINAITSS